MGSWCFQFCAVCPSAFLSPPFLGEQFLLTQSSRYKAASLPASFSGLKTAVTKSGDINFLVYGQAYGNGTAYNEEAAVTPLSTARIYDSIYTRHWDSWLTTISNAVFSGTLKKTGAKSGSGSTYTLNGPLKNLLAGVKNIESPYPPFGGSSDYDISPNGKWVAFKSKAPELPRANHTASYIYLVPHDGSEKAKAINGPDSPGTPEGVKGDSSSPVFSPNSKKIAYVQQADIAYESDRRTLYVYTLGSDKTIDTLAKDWDRSPDAVKWNSKGDEIILGTEDRGRSRLFTVPVNAGDDYKPKNFTDGGVVSGYYNIPNGEFLVTASALWTSWQVYTASPKKGVIKTLFSANKVDAALKGLGPADVGEFYFKGNWTDVSIILNYIENTRANWLQIHSWIIYPTGFDKSKTYPLLYFIHGGPQSSWLDSWSSRWNPRVWADQGYVVVAPNPTGSSGFGDKLTDAIQNNWGMSWPFAYTRQF